MGIRQVKAKSTSSKCTIAKTRPVREKNTAKNFPTEYRLLVIRGSQKSFPPLEQKHTSVRGMVPACNGRKPIRENIVPKKMEFQSILLFYSVPGALSR